MMMMIMMKIVMVRIMMILSLKIFIILRFSLWYSIINQTFTSIEHYNTLKSYNWILLRKPLLLEHLVVLIILTSLGHFSSGSLFRLSQCSPLH